MTWNAANHGLCDVKLFLLFVQNDNSTQNVIVPVANKIYENCNLTMNVTSVRYKTILMYKNDTLNKQKKISEDLYPQITTTTTTEDPTTTTTTTTTTENQL